MEAIKCPHQREVVGKDNYGIYSHYHKDDGSSCDVLNVIGFKVSSILQFYANKLQDTPEFRAAFLVSQKVRLDVYKVMSSLGAQPLSGALSFLYKVVHGAGNERDIWEEACVVFGGVFLENMRRVTKQSMAFAPYRSGLYDSLPKYSMVNIVKENVAGVAEKQQTVIDDWRESAQKVAQEAAANKYRRR